MFRTSAITLWVATDSAHVIDMAELGMESLPNFYSSLPVSAGQIRVLDLDPLPRDHGGLASQTSHDESALAPLSGTLRVVSLADSPKFTALSYVWGGFSSPSDIISVRTSAGVLEDLKITTNCRDALLHLHRQFSKTTTIWIDAICINQRDEQEKNVQVNQMRETFAWADPVYVWLGPGDPQSDKAMDFLAAMSVYEVNLGALEYLLYPVTRPWSLIVGIQRYWIRVCSHFTTELMISKAQFDSSIRNKNNHSSVQGNFCWIISLLSWESFSRPKPKPTLRRGCLDPSSTSRLGSASVDFPRAPSALAHFPYVW